MTNVPLVRTEVQPGDLPDYPDGVVPYGPGNLTDGSDSTGVKFVGDFPLTPFRWYVIFDASGIEMATSLTLRLRFKVNVGPFQFQAVLHDGTSQRDFGDVAELYPWGLSNNGRLASDGLSDHEITIDQAWMDANPGGYYSDAGGSGLGALWDRLRSGDGQVWLFIQERSIAVGNSFDADLLEASLVVNGETVVSYRRTFPRDDALSGGAGRTFPRPRSTQGSNRTSGGYL